jgi:hypothetical protein
MLEFSYGYWLALLLGACSCDGASTVCDITVICFSWKLYDHLSYLLTDFTPLHAAQSFLLQKLTSFQPVQEFPAF